MSQIIIRVKRVPVFVHSCKRTRLITRKLQRNCNIVYPSFGTTDDPENDHEARGFATRTSGEIVSSPCRRILTVLASRFGYMNTLAMLCSKIKVTPIVSVER